MEQFLNRAGLRHRRRITLAMVFLCVGAWQAPAQDARRLQGFGTSGSYLAGVVADSSRDTAAAANYFAEALKGDPRNAGLIDRAFLSSLIDGRVPEAFRLAERALQRKEPNALAQVALGVRAIKAREFTKARGFFTRAGGSAENADLTLSLLSAWALAGAGQTDRSLAILDNFKDADIRAYRDFFAGLVAILGNRPGEGEKRLAAAHKADSGNIRVVDAYARHLSRRGKQAEALGVIAGWRDRNPGQPYLDRQVETLSTGKTLDPFLVSAAEGTAEVFYLLGALGPASQDPFMGIVYLQLARFLSPEDELILTTLAEGFAQAKQYARAADVYAAIPVDSPLANRAVIGRAAALEALERTDDAIAALRVVLKAHPMEYEAADTLGAILRVKKRFAESVDAYDAVIKAVPKLEQKHWSLFFGRAIGHERTKQWPLAEKDFLTALDLLPPKPRTARERAERAQVLNYLAYSWVDMHVNIDRSFEMLREAVSLAPNDGAIVDSLGWAYYRLGRYPEAVKELERAVLLRSGDATINDHLGDAYWKVGRIREAYFKWSQSLDLKPEPDELEKIRKKLESGLEDSPSAAVPATKPNGG